LQYREYLNPFNLLITRLNATRVELLLEGRSLQEIAERSDHDY